jgi:hypothetical protein
VPVLEEKWQSPDVDNVALHNRTGAGWVDSRERNFFIKGFYEELPRGYLGFLGQGLVGANEIDLPII